MDAQSILVSVLLALVAVGILLAIHPLLAQILPLSLLKRLSISHPATEGLLYYLLHRLSRQLNLEASFEIYLLPFGYVSSVTREPRDGVYTLFFQYFWAKKSSDVELAYLLGHELAHVTLHIGTGPEEHTACDRFAVELMEKAGFDPKRSRAELLAMARFLDLPAKRQAHLELLLR